MTAVLSPSATLDPPRIRAELLAWFDASGRTLPWRLGEEGRRDPYRVWVAEILLQQTQVARGLHYYDRFLTAFPTVQALADAPIEAVLKAWEGCGYYARARNLHRAAKLIVLDGFPTDYSGWLALPGVGPYTAAAVASLAFGGACAVNDGNVRRVLARVYGEARPTDAWIQARADALLCPVRPGAWNEAVMDLGATVCTPKAPRCAECPLSAHCAALASGTPIAFPAAKVRTAVRAVQAVAVLIGDEREAVLERREGGLLGGLMGLPMQELQENETPQNALNDLCQRLNARPGTLLGQVSHSMTHRQITLHVYAAASDLPRQTVADAALSRLDHKALGLLQTRQDGLFALPLTDSSSV